jgi:hypothetical protein
MLYKVGLYSGDLGRNGKRPLADEDTDMYHRLLAAGARGIYVPDLIIYHHIHPDRLTKDYFRRWHFWRGVSSGRLDQRQPQPTPYLFGVPRYLFGSAARGFFHMLAGLGGTKKNAAELFGDQLKIYDLFGFFYGKHFYKPSST